jgi:hypothetical protein
LRHIEDENEEEDDLIKIEDQNTMLSFIICGLFSVIFFWHPVSGIRTLKP